MIRVNFKRAKIYIRMYGGGGEGWWQVCAPTIQTSVKIRVLIWGAISSLVFNKSLSNLLVLLILRRPFQWCRRIFANLSISKVEKKSVQGSIVRRENEWRKRGENGTRTREPSLVSPRFFFSSSIFHPRSVLSERLEKAIPDDITEIITFPCVFPLPDCKT